ncbi:MAG: nucleotidyl transferase AbiEii/AbiGii toxin family protein [Kofleriaceae bacterium]
MFVPKLDVLPSSQRALWGDLGAVPSSFVLYGGTALALHLGHRESVDFDFFAHDELDHAALEALPFLTSATTLDVTPNSRTFVVRRGEGVKVSFFGTIRFGRVGAVETTADGHVRVASLLDLAGTKIKALVQRVESKDYRDVDALLVAGVPIVRILGAARALFGEAFNPLVARKALSYFVGGDLDTLDSEMRARLVEAATHDLGIEEPSKISPRLD